ncbi:MAG: acyltransferase family protein [Oscillospiraceae bacterium]|nr:acyltransferase family protein [Oscillospiraceae bacterium]
MTPFHRPNATPRSPKCAEIDMLQSEGGRLVYADLLRVLASFAVVVLHLSGAGLSEETPVGGFDWNVLCVYDALVHWCVPVFVMLSGMFLLEPKKQVTLPSLFRKHILRIFVAALIWSVFYALLDYGYVGGWFTWEGIQSAFHNLLNGQIHYHLWFLFMIIGLYLVTPILRAFVRGARRTDFHWFFALTFVVYSVLPALQALLPSRMALPMLWLSKLNIHIVLGYVGFYVAGYYLKTYTPNRTARCSIYVLGILGAAVTALGTMGISVRAGTFNGALFEYRNPNVVFMAVAIFVLFRYAFGGSNACGRHRWLGGVAQISFGIYLVHAFFITVLRHFGITTLSFSPLVSVPILSVVVFLCAMLVAWVIAKIPLLGRYLT